MTALSPRRFEFDTVFAEDGEVAYSPPPVRKTIPAEEVEALCQQAFARGERSAVVQAEQAQAQALQSLAEAAHAALSTLAAAAHAHREGSAELALAAARKIADAALGRFPEAPLTEALGALAAEIEAAPRLVLRVTPQQQERMTAAAETAAAGIGFTGRFSVVTDPLLPQAAFALDWGDGRAAFDPQAAAARVAEALDAALAAEGLHGEALSSFGAPAPGDF